MSAADFAANRIRIRTGIARFPDGWNVVVEFDGRKQVYDPTFATEAEAEAKAAETAAMLRRTVDDFVLSSASRSPLAVESGDGSAYPAAPPVPTPRESDS